MKTVFYNKVEEINNRTISTEEKKHLALGAFMDEQVLIWGTFKNLQDGIIDAISRLAEEEQTEKEIKTLTVMYGLLGDLETIRTKIQ